MFWKKKKDENNHDNKVILGMVILKDENSFNYNLFIKDLEKNYNVNVEKPTGDNTSMAFNINSNTIIIGHLVFPIPSGDIKGSATYAYNWPMVLEEVKDHKSHLIVSILGKQQSQLEKYKIFTQVLCSLLRTTNSIGIYKGNQSLLISKEQYLYNSNFIDDENLPLDLWIYFGLRKEDLGNSGYTYGLKEFNKKEIEILNSKKELEDIRGLLFNISHYILSNDVNFKDGETCGLSEDEKIKISISNGVLIEGLTYKLNF